MLNWLKKKIAVKDTAPQAPSWAVSSPFAVSPRLFPADLRREMAADGMIQTALTVKRLGVLAATGTVLGTDERRVAFVNDAFSRMRGSIDTVLNQAMAAFADGWSVQETTYAESGGYLWIDRVTAKDPSTITPDLDRFGHLTGLTLALPGDTPLPLLREKFVVYRYRGGYDAPRGQSDLDAVVPHFSAKRSLQKSWSHHLEKFASPTLLGRFERTLAAREQQELYDALRNLPENRVLVHPSDCAVETLDGDKGASTGFMEAIDFHNREIARAILGQTLTTDEGRRVGSLAMGKVHLQVLLLQLATLRRELADVVVTEQIIRPLMELNFGPGEIPRYEFASTTLEAFTTGVV
jgi:phage gp29-like protein